MFEMFPSLRNIILSFQKYYDEPKKILQIAQ